MKKFFLRICVLLFTLQYCFCEYTEDLKFGTPEKRIQVIESISNKGESKYIDLLMEQLEDPDSRVRLSAIKALHKLGAKKYFEKFIEALSDSDQQVCAEIRKTLIDFYDQDTLKILKENLNKNPNPQIRQQIAVLFGEAKEKSAVDSLIKALKDNDFVRFSAVKSLGKIGDKSASDELIKSLKDPLGDIRLQSAKSLIEMKVYRAIPYIMNLLEDSDISVKSEIEQVLNDAVCKETILYFSEGLMKDKRPVVRKYCAKALGLLGEKASAPLLFEGLKDKNKDVRQEVIKSIEKLVDNSMVFSLCLSLKENDINVRTYAVKSILNLKDPRAVPSLIDHLKKEKSPELKNLIQQTIVEISDNSILDFLINALYDKNTLVRITIIQTAGKMQAKEFLPELTRLLTTEKNTELKYVILETIKSFGDKSVVPELNKTLLKEKNDELKLAIINVLKEIGDYSSIPFLLECLKSSNEMLLMEAENLLDKLADQNSVEIFLEALQDKNIAVRTYVMKILKKYPTKRALPYMFKALSDTDVYIRRDAVVILGMIGDESIIPELVKKLKDKEEIVRLEAIKTLGKMEIKEVIDYLKPSLKDSSPAVRLETVKIISEFTTDETLSELQKVFKKESDPLVKEQIIMALKNFQQPSCVKLLKESLEDIEPSIRKSAVQSLGAIGDKTVIPELKKVFQKEINSEVKSEIMLALAKLGAKEMIPEFMNKLSDPLKEISSTAKKTLDILIEKSDGNYLVACIQSDNKDIRNYCLNALKTLKPEESVPEMFRIIKTIKGTTRTQVLNLIDNIPARKTADQFISLVDNPSTNDDTELQIWVIEHIASFNEPVVIDFLSQTIKNENTKIRTATLDALKKIGGKKAIGIIQYVSENDTSLSVRNHAKGLLATTR